MQLIETPRGEEMERTVSPAEEGHRPSVLCVDDDQRILEAMRRSLRGESYCLHTAQSGHEAMEMMDRRRYQVIVTDIGMPGMNGLSLLERTAEHHPDAIRMVLSGQSDTRTVIDAIKAGRIYRYILKPWQNDELAIAIRQALSLWNLRAEKNEMMRQLDRQNKLLEKRVAQRTKQLLAFERQAQIGRQAAQIVHNLNTPLQALTGAIDLLSITSEASGRAQMEKCLSLAGAAASELKTIIAGILSYARQEGRSQQVPMDINRLIEEQVKLFEMIPMFKHHVRKELFLAQEIPTITGNPVEIKQVLGNLIKNALDAMEQRPQKRLTFRTHIEGGMVVITIADTGEGILRRHFNSLFLPEFTTKSDSRGTGLGLASAKTMIDAYGGNIAFESTEGEGTTFFVRLPVKRHHNGFYHADPKTEGDHR